jgi:hypothetical protein
VPIAATAKQIPAMTRMTGITLPRLAALHPKFSAISNHQRPLNSTALNRQDSHDHFHAS